MCPRNDLAAVRPRWPARAPRRSWPWAWLGICVIVVALAWVAQPAAGAALQGEDTISVSQPSVDASWSGTLMFTYTAAADDPIEPVIVTLGVPQNWTQTSPASLSCTEEGSACSIIPSASDQIQVGINLDVTSTFVLYLPATAPAYATTSTFTASEQFQGKPATAAVPLMSPQVIVNCPDDGTGTVTVSPSPVTAGSITNFTLTYQAGSCGVGVGGVITLTVPDTWTPPSPTAGTPGYTTWPGGQLSISPDGVITVPVATLGPEGTISIDYDMAQVPGAGAYMFTAAEQSSTGGTPTALAPAAVQVTPARATPPPPPPHKGGAGQITVTPTRVAASHRGPLRFTYTAPEGGLPASGEVTVQVPAGWTPPSPEPGRAGYVSTSAGVVTVHGRLITVTGAALGSGQTLTITYGDATAPGLAGASTFLTSEGPDGTAGLAALATSPSVTVTPAGPPAPTPGPSPTVLGLVIGLAAVACTAGALAVRRLRRGRHGPGPSSVRAVPQAGPPPTVRIRDTGTRPTLIVRIEPHASDPVSTIKEARP